MSDLLGPPIAAYYATNIRRSAALQPGDVVTLLLGHDENVAEDRNDQYLVTDQADKKGNRLLVSRRYGNSVYAAPGSVWHVL